VREAIARPAVEDFILKYLRREPVVGQQLVKP
jgi:hypothetical protein